MSAVLAGVFAALGLCKLAWGTYEYLIRKPLYGLNQGKLQPDVGYTGFIQIFRASGFVCPG